MRRLKWKDWPLLLFIALPVWAAYDLGASDYDEAWHKLPFSIERAAIGFLVGLLFAAVLYGVIIGIRAIIRKIRSGRISN